MLANLTITPNFLRSARAGKGMQANSKRRLWLDYLVYLAVRIVVCVIQALPAHTCEAMARGLATLVGTRLKVRRRVIEENLTQAYPQLSATERQQLSWQMWEHLFLLICEIAHAPRKIHETNWRDYIQLTGQDYLVRQLLSTRPTVIVSGHYGNFELSGYLLGTLGFPSYTVARTLDNRFLDRYINQFRGAKGQHILPKDGSAQQIDHLLASAGTLVFLADQHAGPKGCWVPFFGRPASTHKAIALFSLCNDAPLALCYSCRRAGRMLRHVLGAEDMIDPRDKSPAVAGVPALTAWYTQGLERIIRRAPQQYWWLHRRWKESPPAKASARPSQAA